MKAGTPERGGSKYPKRTILSHNLVYFCAEF